MDEPLNPYASPMVEEKLSPGAQWVGEMSPSLRRTGLGLSLVYYGIIVMILSGFAAGFGGAMGLREPGIFMTVVGAAGLAMIAGAVLLFVGPLVCLAVPAESGAKGFLIGSVLFQLGNVAYTLLARFSPWADLPMVVAGVLQLLGLVGFVLFVLFMHRLSQFIGRVDLARRARNILVGIVLLIGVGAATGVGIAAKIQPLGMLMLVVLIGALVLFLMYANLVDALRKALLKK